MTVLQFALGNQSTGERFSKHNKQKNSIPGMQYQEVLKQILKIQSDY